MTPLTHLVSCCIIERDENEDTLWTWNYPCIEESIKMKILQKYNIQFQDNSPSFVFFRFGQYWIYICNNDSIDCSKLLKVTQFSLVITTTSYDPQKYEILGKIFSKVYTSSGCPVDILKLYLNVYTTGYCKIENNDNSFANHLNPLESTTNIKGMIKLFELEIILIYTALLLKKRIFIYHHSLDQLLKWINSFPALMRHRNLTKFVFPWVDLSDEEINELQKQPYYVAGCLKMASTIKPELYDIFINFPAQEISIPNHAKEALTMSKIHKEIALFMVQLSENQNLSELQVINEISDRTKDLLNHLITLASATTAGGKRNISFDVLKEKNLPAAVEHFLMNLAVAENLIIV